MSQVAFAQHLRASKEAIIEQWKSAVRRDSAGVPSAQRLTGPEFTDHLPALLERIAMALEGAATPEVEPEGREHGSQRRRVGYDIAEVLREHVILRQTLLDQISAFAVGTASLTPEVRDAVRDRLVDVLDRSGQAAAAEYHAEAMAEQRALEEALEAADHRKDEFLAMLSHELRNPLGVIRNSLYLLRQTSPGEPAWERALDSVKRQVQHQVRMVEDLLDLSRVARGTFELRKTRLDLTTLLREIAEDCRAMLEEAGLTLTLELPGEPVWALADPTRISQVVVNLIHNAVKFTNPGGQVTIRLAADAAWARITVRDTGIGVAAEMLPHMFEPFIQVEGSRERSQGGLGLGLALVKSLVELHGGEVRASSEGPGTGTEFTVLLPREPDAAE